MLEQESFADTIRRFPNKKIVMAEPVKVPMYGSLWISDAPKVGGYTYESRACYACHSDGKS